MKIKITYTDGLNENQNDLILISVLLPLGIAAECTKKAGKLQKTRGLCIIG
jgi:hypothetical protein